MNPALVIRPETDADTDAIREVTVTAFKILAISNYTEQFIVAALRAAGVARMKSLGARGVCLVGHPDDYIKFGFRNAPGLVLEGVPQGVFFARSYDEHIPQGTAAFREAFKADGQQQDTGGAI